MKYANNLLELIGNTPLVKLNRTVGTTSSLVLAKIEYLNPGGSVKDRIAVRMVGPMHALMVLLKPVVWLIGKATDALFRLLGLPQQRDDRITSEDILAMTAAGR